MSYRYLLSNLNKISKIEQKAKEDPSGVVEKYGLKKLSEGSGKYLILSSNSKYQGDAMKDGTLKGAQESTFLSSIPDMRY